jgi:glycosyltransferase involved in cell wall biosynthesis
MKLLTISNLYPWPDQPTRGTFNAQLFRAFAEQLNSRDALTNICLVPEWRVWRWKRIQEWQDPCSPPFSTAYLPVPYVPLIGRNWSRRTYLSSLRALHPLVEDADVVFSTWLYPDGVAATRLALAGNKPSWIMVQGSDTFHLRNSTRRKAVLEACSAMAGLICVCRSLADRLIEAGVNRDKIHIAPNGVDTSLFQYRTREDARRQLSLVPTLPYSHTPVPPHVLFVGNLVPVKGPDILLEAWARLQNAPPRQLNNPATRQLIVIGAGSMRRQLERQVHRLGIADTVTFLGARPHYETSLWMNAADCLCLSSRSEGMPNVVLEALASGLPLVAADVGACREMLEREPLARVVPVESVDSLVRALSDTLDHSEDRRSMAHRHGRRAWSDQAREILELIAAGLDGE